MDDATLTDLPINARQATPIVALPFESTIADLEERIDNLERQSDVSDEPTPDVSEELADLRSTYQRLLHKTYAALTPWQTVQVARHPQRPLFLDYVSMLCREFREIHGDRRYGDDRAIRCGFARIGGRKVVLIGHHKGRTTKERIECMFGCANPEGYRKALRVMKLAEKFGLPVVTLVDTPGAYPGIGAEERGQAESIAVNLMEMARLRTPIVSVVIGEGGSGGALGLAVADAVAMSQNAWYSVISPEACSSILFKDASKASTMADSLKLTSRDLTRFGVIDAVVPEPVGGAHRDPLAAAHQLEAYIGKTLKRLERQALDDMDGLLDARYHRFRRLGEYAEPSADEQIPIAAAG
jgi:acetyl-CoA carboxylase carboxyl transferase subunit alpha